MAALRPMASSGPRTNWAPAQGFKFLMDVRKDVQNRNKAQTQATQAAQGTALVTANRGLPDLGSNGGSL